MFKNNLLTSGHPWIHLEKFIFIPYRMCRFLIDNIGWVKNTNFHVTDICIGFISKNLTMNWIARQKFEGGIFKTKNRYISKKELLKFYRIVQVSPLIYSLARFIYFFVFVFCFVFFMSYAKHFNAKKYIHTRINNLFLAQESPKSGRWSNFIRLADKKKKKTFVVRCAIYVCCSFSSRRRIDFGFIVRRAPIDLYIDKFKCVYVSRIVICEYVYVEFWWPSKKSKFNNINRRTVIAGNNSSDSLSQCFVHVCMFGCH